MTSLFESDFRTSSAFPLHQEPEQAEAHYITSPYFWMAGPGYAPNLAFSYNSYLAPNVFLDSLQHVQSEYDCFVNGVISDVLISIEDGAAYTPPYEEKLALPMGYPVSQGCDELMWGSDLSFGPNRYSPPLNSPPETQLDHNLVYLYTESIRPLSTQAPTAKLAAEMAMPIKQGEQSPELNRGGLQKITGKKRRRLLHIIAERNRRLNQNKLYEELYRLVPGLENTARSTKREVLTRTANWLEQLVEDNEKLQEQLRRLPPRPGHSHR